MTVGTQPPHPQPLSPTGEGSVTPPEFRPLAADASPEAKDRHWYETMYQGDRVPQLTLRAVLMGGVLGMLMAVGNLYTVMKVGLTAGVAITACVLSYVTWNLLRAVSGGRLTQMSILENNCMQSTASAAGYSTASMLAVIFAALMMLDPEHKHQPWVVVAAAMPSGNGSCSWLISWRFIGIARNTPIVPALMTNVRITHHG